MLEAGGRAIDTPFGAVYSSNLTSDAETGLGRWNTQDFWNALHHGRSRGGRLLAPAFRGWQTPLGVAIHSALVKFQHGECSEPAIATQIGIMAAQVVDFAKAQIGRSD